MAKIHQISFKILLRDKFNKVMKVKGAEGVFVIKGENPGKTVAIFGGIHGNEVVGVKMIDILRKELEVEAGTVYLAYGNLEAIKKGKRFVEKNLNRCFVNNSIGKTNEEVRARELMKVLDKCDALLDLHSFTNSQGERFAICEENAFDIASKCDVPVISFGWNDVEPGGTDDYMYGEGKVAMCVECGPHHKVAESLKCAKFAVDVFLKYFDCISGEMVVDNSPKKYVKVSEAIIRKSTDFKFSKDYKNFDNLEEGKVFATEDGKKYIARKDECIVLPTPKEPIGGEICLLGKIVDNEK